MSFKEFIDLLRSDVTESIEQSNRQVEEELPQILEIKPSIKQRSLLLNPHDARRHLKDMIEKQDVADKFMDVVTGVRGEKVHITTVEDGQREDKRDKILKAVNPDTGEQLMDYRLLIGDPKRKGADIRNEVSQAAFYKLLNLRVYREKAHLQRVA
ncbi:MAG: hypothetical protein KKD39_04485 [Candidatus Altiarchaeota archaeon]|nr:hypothetical protein [Candidatus Altiarchaeota archaeon]